MKILVFSDTHLTDKFDKELFDYIVKLVKSADQVIINGDFWDGYLISFDQFIKSEWKKLFPLLKKKKAVYIFGNHDKLKFMDQRMSLFSKKQAMEHQFRSGNKDFLVTHGHLIIPTFDNKFLLKNLSLARFLYRILIWVTNRSKMLFKLHKKFEDQRNMDQFNTINEYVEAQKTKQFFIIGHSHIPNLNIKKRLISLGILQNNERYHCMIENGTINLIENESKNHE